MDGIFTIAGHARATLPLDVLAALTLLSIAPIVLVMSTSFVRIIVVLSLVRSAIGAASLPPNTVLTGLALVLTTVIMSPTFTQINDVAVRPYASGSITPAQFADRALTPLRAFMLRQTHLQDSALFERIAHRPSEPPQRAPLTVIVPAFVVGELRDAFAIGLALYLPFVAIDLAVASILMGLGMFMLSPPVISLPAKLLLFVMVDGCYISMGDYCKAQSQEPRRTNVNNGIHCRWRFTHYTFSAIYYAHERTIRALRRA